MPEWRIPTEGAERRREELSMKWRSSFIAVAVGVPVLALFGFGLTRDPGNIPSPLPGRQAPEFSLVSFSTGNTPKPTLAVGDTVRLSALRGRVVVLNFWASWCLACRGEHPTLLTVGQMYAGTDVRFLGVLYNDSPENGKRWLTEMGMTPYPSLTDPSEHTAIDYGLYGVPETFIIGRDGRVAYKQTGPVSDSLLIAQIEKLRGDTAATAGRTSP
jgi:cytochrome c biogenesis protein CcmG, thiol:disulfide interchange protein DsbE